MITSIKGDSVNKIFWQLLDASKEWPKGVVRRDARATVDSPGPVIVHLTDPCRRVLSILGRNNSLPAACAETLWVLAGRNDVAWLEYYLPRAKDYSDDSIVWRAGYGPRLRHRDAGYTVDPLALTVQELRERPESRRAVIDLFDESDYCHYTAKDFPCNIVLNFLVRQGKLDLIVYCRSNDLLYGASGINWFEFTVMQELVADMTGLPLGEYYHVSNSLHYYAEFEGRFERMRVTERVDPYDTEVLHRRSRLASNSITGVDYALRELFALEDMFHTEDCMPSVRPDVYWGCLHDLVWVVLGYVAARRGWNESALAQSILDPHMRRGLQETIDRERKTK